MLENYERYILDFISGDHYSEEQREEFEKAVKEFQEDYTPEKIRMMTLDEYLNGYNGKSGFLKRMQKDTEVVGKISPRPGAFGVYLNNKGEIIKTKSTDKYGNTVEEVFNTYKNKLLEIQMAAVNNDKEALSKIKFPETIKLKLAVLFNTKDFFTVFSIRHLQHFLVEMTKDFSYKKEKNYYELVQILLDEKDAYPLIAGFSDHKYSRLLYYLFGKVNEEWEFQIFGVVHRDNGKKKISNFDDPLIVEKDNNSTLAQAPKREIEFKENRELPKLDFEKKERELSVRGNLAELKVVEYERSKLIKLGMTWEASQVEQISKKNDIAGYDVLSFNEDGSKRYIEVKSTIGKGNSFYISLYEKLFSEQSKHNKDYWIYFVRKTAGSYLVKEIHNPFLDETKDLLNIQATKYKVDMSFKS